MDPACQHHTLGLCKWVFNLLAKKIVCVWLIKMCFVQYLLPPISILAVAFNGSCHHFQNRCNAISDTFMEPSLMVESQPYPLTAGPYCPPPIPTAAEHLLLDSLLISLPWHIESSISPKTPYIRLRFRNLFHFVVSSPRAGVLIWGDAALVQNYFFWVLECRKGVNRYPYIWRGYGTVRSEGGF